MDLKKQASAKDEPTCKKAKLESDEIAVGSKDVKLEDKISDKEESACKKAKLDSGETADNKEIELEDKTSDKDEPACKKAKLDSDETAGEKLPESTETSEANATLKPLTEVEAGISEYLGAHTGFSAIIKQRYSDFNVNEIGQDGKVVHITDLSVPEIETAPEDTVKKVQEFDLTVVDEEHLNKLQTLVKSEDKSGHVNIPAPDAKNLRTKVHLLVKQTYPQLETKTEEVDGQKVIQAFWKKGKSRDSRKDEWPTSKKSCRFVKFVLYKENKDTMDAIGLIAKLLKVKENLFQYAGTKDKRARTCQEITANRVHPQKLVFLNKMLRNMGVGNFRYVEEPLKLGQLLGNRFTIVLRNVEANKKVVDAALASLKEKGFINYFGMQRFGTTSVPTHKIGSALLHGDWKKAVDLILMPRNDEPTKAKFQKIWQKTGDATKTLREVPRYCGLERNLLQGLEKNSNHFNALEKISRNTRLLYVHSYQALVWNRIASRRLSKLGHKPVVGDLVLPKGSSPSDKSEPTVLDKDNINEYTIHDLVLPLPGYNIVYPKNEVHDWFREILRSDELDIDDMKRPQKDYSLPGSYRYLTVDTKDVSWSHHRYDDYTLPLTASDWDILRNEDLPESVDQGKYRAVVLQMTLPPSCYATMALREVMKVDTSAAFQTSLNVT